MIIVFVVKLHWLKESLPGVSHAEPADLISYRRLTNVIQHLLLM